MSLIRMRYRLWHLMAVVAITALIAGGYVYLFRRESQGSSSGRFMWTRFEFFIVINGHEFRHTSPVFWLILVLQLTILIGLLVGFIALIVWTARVIGRRYVRHK